MRRLRCITTHYAIEEDLRPGGGRSATADSTEIQKRRTLVILPPLVNG